MKIAKLLSLLALILITASLVSAQGAVDVNDDSCWQSLSSLRACQIAQQQLVTAQAERCTSFPEYQCTPEPESIRLNVEAKKARKPTALSHGVSALHVDEHVSSAARSAADAPGREAVEIVSPR